MKDVGQFWKLVALELYHQLRFYKRPLLVLASLLGCLVACATLKALVQPADAMQTPVASISGYYADDSAYYCERYGSHGSSVAAACQAPALVAASIVATMSPVLPGHRGSCHAYDPIFSHYPWNISIAEAICQAESGGNPSAISPTNDYGLMQLHNMPIFDPSQNIAAAYRKFQVQGWEAWTTYITGAYAQYL